VSVLERLRHARLSVKVSLLGAGSTLIAAAALVALATWQSGLYNRLAQKEVDELIEANLDHIARGVYNLARTENEAVQQQVDHNLNVAEHVLSSTGGANLSERSVVWTATNQFTNGTTQVRLPRMLAGERWLGQNTDPAVPTAVVDDVSRLVGETATVFQRMNERGDMLRVATNVTNADGRRAIGTYIPAVGPDSVPNPVITAVLDGRTYHGRAFVVDSYCLTAYKPIHDDAGRLVGMLYVGVKQKTIESRVRGAILETRVGRTGYVYVLGGSGETRGRYIVSQNAQRDGEDVWESRDSDGHLVIQTIIRKAIAAKRGELTTVRYRWRNPGEPAPRWKVARLVYFAPWDWVIGVGVYEDELQAYRAVLEGGRARMTRFMGAAGLGIALLVGLAGVLIAWTIARPVRRLTAAAETIMRGNLDQVVEVDAGDEIGILASTFNSMTAQLKGTLEGLRRSEENYRGIFENALEGIFLTSLDGRVLKASPALARMLGYDSADEMAVLLTDLRRQLYVHAEDRDAMVAAALEQGAVLGREMEFRRKDGQVTWVSISVRVVGDDTGKPLFLQGFLTDINERKQAEERLLSLAAAVDQAADDIIVTDVEGSIRYVNAAFERTTGRSRDEVVGQSSDTIWGRRHDDALRQVVWDTIRTGHAWQGRLRSHDGAGRAITQDVSVAAIRDRTGRTTGSVTARRDVTRQIEIEGHAVQAEKLEAIGTLAGGIAHDFNNILTAIAGYTELAQMKCPADSAIRHDLDAVLQGSRRAIDLVKQILAFSRQTGKEEKPVQVGLIVKEATKFLRASIPSTIEISSELRSESVVLADPTDLHRVVINLCTNAALAMRDHGGVLDVGLDDLDLDATSAARYPGLRPGGFVRLSVRDTGCGMTREVMARIFEPFYTTRDNGEGTGMGLAVVHGIVKSCRGTIAAESEPGHGTTFEVLLPVIRDGADAAPLDPGPLVGGTERILFVDDEPLVAHLASDILGDLGYQVRTRTNGLEALQAFVADPAAVDLVITDMTMPGMTGDVLAERLKSIRPELPVILCTGYSEKASAETARAQGIDAFMMKPILRADLARLIRKVLDHA
jgi:PAS domain S-box-containing protein